MIRVWRVEDRSVSPDSVDFWDYPSVEAAMESSFYNKSSETTVRELTEQEVIDQALQVYAEILPVGREHGEEWKYGI